jgi:small-conductance mechanosensitive channel
MMRHPTLRCPALRLPRAVATLLALALLIPGSLRAQADTLPPPSPAGAPVLVAGDTVFLLYGNLGPFSAAERAVAVTDRMRRLSADIGSGVDTIVVTDRDGGSELSVRDVVIMTVLDADLGPDGGDRRSVARVYAARLTAAAAANVRETTPKALLLDGLYALIATVVLIILLRAMRAAFPRLYARVRAIRASASASLRIQNFELLSAERISTIMIGALRLLRAALTLLLLYIYVPLVLSFFPWTRPLSRRIVGYVLDPLAVVGASFVAFLPNLFFIVVIVFVTRYVLKAVHAVFNAMGSGALSFDGFYPDWADPTYKLARIFVIAFAAVILFPYLPGARSDAFKGVSLFLGVLFSIGSSAAVGNMVAGVLLTYTRAFKVGDRVKIGDTFGDITEKSLLVTRVRTIKNVEITIPNGSVLGGPVINYSTLAPVHGLILHTTVTIGYDVPWAQVHQLLIDAAGRTEHIMPTPAPFVLQTSLDDFYVSYQLNAFTNRPDIMAGIYSQLHVNIQDCFNEGGVEIMSPHYGALRDGNQSTIPAGYLPPDYQAPSFRHQGTGQPT